MAFNIPKIEYLNVSTTGNTTISNGVITNIPDTSAISVGMFVEGTGIPAGSTVGSKTSTTVTLASSVLATANGTGVSLSFGFRITFDYPPKENKGEMKTAKATVSTSISGVRQTSTQHIEANRNVNFSFLSETLYQLVNTFAESHALYGREFRYYDNKNSISYLDYQLDDLKIDPKKIAPKGEDIYVWEVAFKFSRVL